VALSLGLPQPAINRRHAFLESGLSSLSRSHPAIREVWFKQLGALMQCFLYAIVRRALAEFGAVV